MKIVKYVHHGVEVSVMEEEKGKHREHCLCWAHCKFFIPDTTANCPIAHTLFELDKLWHVTTPVFECAKYEMGE